MKPDHKLRRDLVERTKIIEAGTVIRIKLEVVGKEILYQCDQSSDLESLVYEFVRKMWAEPDSYLTIKEWVQMKNYYRPYGVPSIVEHILTNPDSIGYSAVTEG